MEKRNIAVIFGGCSPEYQVSLESAYAVITHMDSDRYNPVPVGISADGSWYHFTGEAEKIRLDAWNDAAFRAPALAPLDLNARALLVLRDTGIEKITLDAAFPVLHGKNGEDGTVQGLLELAGIPIVGCGVLASALCMDKARAHKLAQAAGAAVPVSAVLERHMDLSAAFFFADKLGYPLFVKPLRGGSSYGITKVTERDALPAAIKLAVQFDSAIILEETISGFEIGCAVLGNEELIVGELDEIELAGGFFNFLEKYTPEHSAIHIPARISSEKTEEVKKTAQRIYRALGCRGFARVDMFLENTGRVVFNEVNTIPGFTVHSRYPNMMKAAGMSFAQVVSYAIELAVGE